VKNSTLIARAIVIASMFLLGAAYVSAQDKPPLVSSAPAPAALQPPLPIAEDAQKLLQALSTRAGGLEDSKAVLQKELDAVVAEINRTVARVQAAAPAGYELGPNLTYVKKADPPKKKGGGQ